MMLYYTKKMGFKDKRLKTSTEVLVPAEKILDSTDVTTDSLTHLINQQTDPWSQ